MSQPTFLERMTPVLDTMPEGPDKEKLRMMIHSQDTIERPNLPPKERARAMRRMTQIQMAALAAANAQASTTTTAD